MKYNQRTLQLDPYLSKLTDSLCFELAVNFPDQNSASLLQYPFSQLRIIDMRKATQIDQEQFKLLYKDWLQAKNIFDIFTAKQVRIYQKTQLLANSHLNKYVQTDSILGSLQLLNSLHNDLYSSRKGSDPTLLQNIESLFEYLDSNGYIHLGLGQLFFLAAAHQIHDNGSIPLSYEQFKPYFKKYNKELCEVQGMTSLRCFKNYYINKNNKMLPKQILEILQEIQKGIASKTKKTEGGLPDILTEALVRWRNTPRFTGLFENKKKKFDIYQRIFMEDEQLFFFNGKDQNLLTINAFSKKYGQIYVKSLQMDTPALRQFGDIIQEVLNDYLSVIGKVSVLMGGKASPQPHQNIPTKSSHMQSSGMYNTSGPQHNSHNMYQHDPYNPFKTSQASHRKQPSNAYAMSAKGYQNSGFKEKTPTKKNKGNQTRRFNVTPTQKHNRMSPLVRRQFGSTEKSLSKSKNMTPTKSFNNGNYNGMINHSTQQYKNSKKEGLEKDSVYEKLFFFRNKRVESFDIVMKRLKGK